MTVRKAVIAAAGLGTRMYPITKTIDKAMLPIGRRPAIDYIVRECARAGVEQIAIVVRGKSTLLHHYYGDDKELRTLLAANGWGDKVSLLDETGDVPELTFIEQSLERGYGTALPVQLCSEFIGDDPFYFISSDDLLVDPPGESTLKRLATMAGDGWGIVGHPTGPENLCSYGVLITEAVGGALFLRGMAEKPHDVRLDRAPLLIDISRYVFPAAFLATLGSVSRDPGSGEYRLTDGLLAVLQSEPDAVRVQLSQGAYFDIGSAYGLLAATNHFATTV